MRNLLYSLTLATLLLFANSCISDKGEIAAPIDGCDTTYFTTQIKPIVQSGCALTGCHVIGGSGPGDFKTYAGMLPSLASGDFKTRINLNPLDPSFMPQTGALSASDLQKLNDWFDSGYVGCD
jgi:hypothetical protein